MNPSDPLPAVAFTVVLVLVMGVALYKTSAAARKARRDARQRDIDAFKSRWEEAIASKDPAKLTPAERPIFDGIMQVAAAREAEVVELGKSFYLTEMPREEMEKHFEDVPAPGSQDDLAAARKRRQAENEARHAARVAAQQKEVQPEAPAYVQLQIPFPEHPVGAADGAARTFELTHTPTGTAAGPYSVSGTTLTFTEDAKPRQEDIATPPAIADSPATAAVTDNYGADGSGGW